MAKKKQHWTQSQFHLHPYMSLFIAVIILAMAALMAFAKPDTGGFDEFGYNYKARIFVGPVDGADRNLDGTYWGDTLYAEDHLVMKWSKAWDDARFRGAAWTPEAWTDNEWNGMNNGSGEVWHYKIVWVGPELENSQYWRDGGYPIWGQFEVIFSQGTDANGHFWDAHASPAGYGMANSI